MGDVYYGMDDYWETQKKEPTAGGQTNPELEARTNDLVNEDLKGKTSLEILYANADEIFKKNQQLAQDEAKRAAQSRETDLRTQMSEQRVNLQKGRQDISRDSYMGGRNLLAGLANKGLATSGLLQLGNVQNTIAKGQQISNLQTGFNRAQESLGRGLSENTAGLTASLRGINLETEGKLNLSAQGLESESLRRNEMLTAYTNELSGLLATAETDEQKEAIIANYSPILDALGGGGGGAEAGATPGSVSTAQTLADSLRVDPQAGTSADEAFVAAQTAIEPYKSVLTKGESADFRSHWLENNPLLNSSDPIVKALSATNGVPQSVIRTDKSGGKGGYNDTYEITVAGQAPMSIDGGQLAAAVMSGQITVSDEILKEIGSNFAGKLKETGGLFGIFGRKYDSISKSFNEWLKESGKIHKSFGSETYEWK